MRNQEHSHADKRCRFSIRKTRLCVGSVLIGLLWIGGSGQSIYAQETVNQPSLVSPDQGVGEPIPIVETAETNTLAEEPTLASEIGEGEQPAGATSLRSMVSTPDAAPAATPAVVNTETEVENHGPLPSEAQLNYHKEELAAFIHFGMNTFTGVEWGNGQESPQSFNPTELDTDQWIRELKNAGFKRTIMVVKHHDGFVLYPSAHTDHDVASSPWKNGQGDVLEELSTSATKYDMNLGVYLSPWDAHHPKYSVATQDEYNQYYLDQLKEILDNPKYGNNGKFVEVWMVPAVAVPKRSPIPLTSGLITSKKLKGTSPSFRLNQLVSAGLEMNGALQEILSGTRLKRNESQMTYPIAISIQGIQQEISTR